VIKLINYYYALKIIDEAKVLQTAQMGFGSTRIPTTTYQVSVNGTDAYVVMTSDCIPIGESVKGVSGGGIFNTDQSVYFFVLRIREVSDFISFSITQRDAVCALLHPYLKSFEVIF